MFFFVNNHVLGIDSGQNLPVGEEDIGVLGVWMGPGVVVLVVSMRPPVGD